ncbi:hypothetical protein BJF91_19105 [Allorhizobium taibaishanense]|uniref:Uncharacterized protein n=1 Tax=Allorhizobium taibaishanense TaxID=887144 RepID=A0A1Q9A3S4_9HYPH|nr:hypothetical protein BJF91_19105 [Allorhizobium taibaishanense]
MDFLGFALIDPKCGPEPCSLLSQRRYLLHLGNDSLRSNCFPKGLDCCLGCDRTTLSMVQKIGIGTML